jgi:outer membrane protein assembly factor BamB
MVEPANRTTPYRSTVNKSLAFLAHAALATLLIAWGAIARGDDWPQWLGPTRDGVWHETGIVEELPAGGPKRLWRADIGGGYAGPAVAAGRVYVMDFIANAAVQNDPGSRAVRPGTERVLCFDARTGQLVWKHEYPVTYEISYPAGPRATATVRDGKVYTLGAEGMLLCLNAATGQVLWQHDLKKEFAGETPMWGFTCHPLCDDTRVYCLTGGQQGVITAFDKDNGKVLWQSVPAPEIGYSTPTLIQAGGRTQLVFWHPKAIVGLNPESGHVYWSVPIEPMYGMSIMAPLRWNEFLFVGGIGNQSVLLRLDAGEPRVTEVYRGTPRTSLYSVCAPPIVHDGILYGSCQQGHFRAVKLESGERLWETFQPTTGKDRASSACAYVVRNGDRFFLFNEKGDLIIARLTPEGYHELSRAHVLDPTNEAFGRDVVWCHPAFADRCMFVRNDKELVCFSLAK